MAQFTYDFNGTDTAAGATIPVAAGLLPLVAYSGTWRRAGNRAVSTTADTSRPMLGLDPGGVGNFDLSVKLSAGGGDALYGRWVDAANWICARVRKFYTTASSSYTEYYYQCGWYNPDGQIQTVTQGWGSCPVPPGNYSQTYSTITDSRQQSYFYNVENWQVVLEKSVSGVVTQLGTATTSGSLTSLRLRGIGNALAVFLNGATTASITATETAHVTATKHGIGRGPSELSGSALDDLFVDNLNTAPNAPSLNAPGSNQTIDRDQPNRLAWTFSDPDAGDSQSAASIRYRVVGAASWTIVMVTGPASFYEVPAGTLAAGSYEWQVQTTDAAGLVGPCSASQFFAAASAPPGVGFLTPVNGETITASSVEVGVSYATGTMEWRVLADLSGSPDTGTVLSSGSTDARVFTIAGLVNSSVIHIQARNIVSGLAGVWSSIRTPVTFTPPPTAQPSLLPAVRTFEGQSVSVGIRITPNFPVPSGGQPAIASYALLRSELNRGNWTEARVLRGAQQLSPLFSFEDLTTDSDKEFRYSIRADGVNGTTSLSEPVEEMGGVVVITPGGEGDFEDDDFSTTDFA